MNRGIVFFGAVATLFNMAPIAHSQSVPQSIVVASCGAASYTAGVAYPVTQNTAGQQCTTGPSSTTTTLQPSASTTYGTTTAVTSTAAACQVIKASAGNLYSASGYVSAASWIMVFNATSAPANGTVTPVAMAYAPTAGSWAINYGTIPTFLSTGITVCASSTGPFTLTQFATSNFITGQFQ
jgi:hypothetical protein